MHFEGDQTDVSQEEMKMTRTMLEIFMSKAYSHSGKAKTEEPEPASAERNCGRDWVVRSNGSWLERRRVFVRRMYAYWTRTRGRHSPGGFDWTRRDLRWSFDGGYQDRSSSEIANWASQGLLWADSGTASS